MASRKEDKQALREERLRNEAALAHRDRARRIRNRLAVGGVAALAGLGGLFALSTSGKGGGANATKAGQYRFVVARPGLDARAPTLKLASTKGGVWDLAAQRGKTTLLYFQEGLGCQPCWEQIKDIERNRPKLAALGIDQVVSITGNKLDQLKQKAADEGISTPVLADPGLGQSSIWGANQQGMMGDAADGHSFVIVDPKGIIRARADYGGAPDYTMYLPVASLASDLRTQLALPQGS